MLTDKDQLGALTYLRGAHRVAVMPSLVENSPLSILECIGASISFLASTAGGIPEMIKPEDHHMFLFEPQLQSIVTALVRESTIPRNLLYSKYHVCLREVSLVGTCLTLKRF